MSLVADRNVMAPAECEFAGLPGHEACNTRHAMSADDERAFLAILDRTVGGGEHAGEIRRDLRALFLKLTPREANAVVRRVMRDRFL